MLFLQACDYFVLVGSHVEAVAQLNLEDILQNKRVPDEAKQLSAFFRVWWCAPPNALAHARADPWWRGGSLVEMQAALTAKKPVVMLVGAAAEGEEELRFVPNKAMLEKLFNMIDVEPVSYTHLTLPTTPYV